MRVREFITYREQHWLSFSSRIARLSSEMPREQFLREKNEEAVSEMTVGRDLECSKLVLCTASAPILRPRTGQGMLALSCPRLPLPSAAGLTLGPASLFAVSCILL